MQGVAWLVWKEVELGYAKPMQQEFGFFHQLRVRWGEVDAQGVVYFVQYLAYFDLGITEYWRAIGLNYPADMHAEGLDLFVASAKANYKASARYDQWVSVGVRVVRLGRSSITYRVAVFEQERLLAEGEVVSVVASLEQQKSQPIPAWLRQKILAFERHLPEGAEVS